MKEIVPEAEFTRWATGFINRADSVAVGPWSTFDIIEPEWRYVEPPHLPGVRTPVWISGKRMARFEMVEGKWKLKQIFNLIKKIK